MVGGDRRDGGGGCRRGERLVRVTDTSAERQPRRWLESAASGSAVVVVAVVVVGSGCRGDQDEVAKWMTLDHPCSLGLCPTQTCDAESHLTKARDGRICRIISRNRHGFFLHIYG